MKNKNPKAAFTPCSAHSLNVVGACAAERCLEAVSLFGFIQSLSNFFSASTRRWEILTAHLTECERGLTPKSLSGTRWSARADATKALRFGSKAIQDAGCYVWPGKDTPGGFWCAAASPPSPSSLSSSTGQEAIGNQVEDKEGEAEGRFLSLWGQQPHWFAFF